MMSSPILAVLSYTQKKGDNKCDKQANVHKFPDMNIPPISVESENSDDLICVRLFLRSAASEPDIDWNCELWW